MNKSTRLLLVAGDFVTLALVTAYGFASHNELGQAGTRLLTTYLPLLAAWLLLGIPLGVFDLKRASDPRQLWRPFWAMVLAGPMAGWLRGVMINQAILPLFVVILGGVSALAILAWRLLFWWIFIRRRVSDG